MCSSDLVIFLCGVMVGRGVRTQATHELADAPEAIIADPTLPGVEPSTTVPAPPPPASTPNGTPSGSTEELTYSGRLLGAEPPDELKEPVSPGSRDRNLASALVESNPLAPVTTPRLAPGKADVKSAAGDTAVPSSAARGGDFAEPAGTGFVVQVAAVKSRTEANTIARRLSGKG